MSILGNIDELMNKEDEDLGYVTPAVIRDEKNYISFKKAFVISTGLHIAAPFIIGAISFILLLMGIHLFTVDRPKPKMNDIEFVLVDKEATPINKKTPYRSHINSRAGGHHDPKRKVSMPSPKPAKTVKKSSPSPSPAKKVVKKAASPAQSAKTQKVTKKLAPAKTSTQPAKTATNPKPTKAAAPTVKPSVKPAASPKPVAKPTTPYRVPVPPSANTDKTYSSGPVGGTGTANTHSGGKYSPSPSLAPTYGSGSGSKSGSRSSTSGTGTKGSTGSKGGTGNYGNPGPGNPNGRPGIDAIAEPDFGPYMRDLQRRIKMNWDPPKGNESKRVVLLFRIAKDGRLLSCQVSKSSGLAAADNAAMHAVKLTAPFRPLPANFRGQSIDIQFTFDYNVFGASYR